MSLAFEPTTVGRYTLRNRVVMAPMTRSRAYGPGPGPTRLMATYYAQRAGAGLIITESAQPSRIGQGHPNTPGLHSGEQVEAWRAVTEGVHEQNGLIFAQLMHAGRVGHPSLHEENLTPVGPSPVRATGSTFTLDGPQEFVTPRALDAAGIRRTIEDYASAARNAIAAGFDGVEVHAAYGFLPHQFLSTNANQRDDEWGGSVQGRIRFTVEAAKAVADAIDADRVGVRISPVSGYQDIVEDNHRDTYLALLDALGPIGLAYLHVAEGIDTEFTDHLRERWNGTFLLNPYTPGGYTGPEALKLIETGAADLVSFGSLFLANPDLPLRLQRDGPFNTPDYSLAYGGDHRGYTDYPTLSQATHDDARQTGQPKQAVHAPTLESTAQSTDSDHTCDGRAVTMTAPPQFQQLGSDAGSRPATSQDPQCQCATIRAVMAASLSLSRTASRPRRFRRLSGRKQASSTSHVVRMEAAPGPAGCTHLRGGGECPTTTRRAVRAPVTIISYAGRRTRCPWTGDSASACRIPLTSRR